MVDLSIECDQCGHYYRVKAPDSRSAICPQCGTSPGTVDSAWSLEQGCPLCGCRHLYRRKAFNQLLGLAIMMLGAVLALAVSYWFLLLFGLMDLVLYRLVPELAVCYRCGVEVSMETGVARLEPFDHHTAEIYTYEGRESGD